MPSPLSHLAPARRRTVAAAFGLLAVLVAAGVVAVVLQGRDDVRPVAQDRPGPVLLVPGYGGSTSSLEVLGSALEREGREVRLVRPPDGGTGDLDAQAEHLADAVGQALDETGADSVDLVGYSAGGVVVRLYVADLGGGSTVRRAVTLASPHHGTDLAALAGSLGSRACPEACQQLAPDSTLLRALNAGDETPSGPQWVALWTADDRTVVPASSGVLAGALDLRLQDLCPDETVAHPDVPRDPVVVGVVQAVLSGSQAALPGPEVCHNASR
ncbi:lipase family alpha/beta hydrolase [Nocardioides acrostichi]|uniref:Alpha/beta fold hydrolase n=1 Tax=Nocardioides acrostichi TaxID=2784339 RepID=A0A930V340_9ACTN|nr:alpha/beta fold hydrolase [Nocardioides acrostichi]MBF4163795.1 alpha/beta fold hydrolase [Nocardioides acrostichi]